MGDAITREIGFVAPVAADWPLSETALPLSVVFMMLGISAAGLGPWQTAVGHRKALLCSSLSFGGGLLMGAAGIYYHSLPLVYLGYGVFGGLGLGLAYTPPIQALINWFPDKKGLAGGMAIAGFGSGALVFTPLAQSLMKHFAVLPEYIGPKASHVVQMIDGQLYTTINGNLTHVVEALPSDLAKLSYQLSEGLYIVGSGSTGAAEALAVLGLTYFSIIFGASLTLRKPHASYVPEGYVPPVASPLSGATSGNAITSAPVDVSMQEAIR
jgi:MFS family permease